MKFWENVNTAMKSEKCLCNAYHDKLVIYTAQYDNQEVLNIFTVTSQQMFKGLAQPLSYKHKIIMNYVQLNVQMCETLSWKISYTND